MNKNGWKRYIFSQIAKGNELEKTIRENLNWMG